MAWPQTKLLIFRIYDKNQAKKNQNSKVAFLVNPLEGAQHGLKLIQLKIQQHIYFKNFLKVATFIFGPKNFSSQN